VLLIASVKSFEVQTKKLGPRHSAYSTLRIIAMSVVCADSHQTVSFRLCVFILSVVILGETKAVCVNLAYRAECRLNCLKNALDNEFLYTLCCDNKCWGAQQWPVL
jgi:hypothetical protein